MKVNTLLKALLILIRMNMIDIKEQIGDWELVEHYTQDSVEEKVMVGNSGNEYKDEVFKNVERATYRNKKTGEEIHLGIGDSTRMGPGQPEYLCYELELYEFRTFENLYFAVLDELEEG